MYHVIDFETYCDLSLPDVGVIKYVNHSSFRIVCMGYSNENGEANVWLPGQPFPDIEGMKYAHNAWFDYNVWKKGECLYAFPETSLDQWVDSQALCLRFSLPPSLDKVGDALNLKTKKDPRGKALIKKICSPGSKYTPEEFEEFLEYCYADVLTTLNLIKTLPCRTLTTQEQLLWKLTQDMNKEGLPVDIKEVKQIYKVTERYIQDSIQRLPVLSNGLITTQNQTQRIVNFCEDKGVSIPNLQAGTVEEFLKSDLPPDVREILEIRAATGKSSIKKYAKIIQREFHGRVYDNLIYHGASTGRWTGSGMQIHNLPRASVEDPEKAISMFMKDKVEGNPVFLASALIRPLLKAKEKESFIVSDYKAIENRLLVWFANDKRALNLLSEGECQYKDMASTVFGTPYKNISKDQRFVGKVIVLGCGYGMGSSKFKATAGGYGLELDDETASRYVQAYRHKYKNVVTMWYRYSDFVKFAILHKKTIRDDHCSFSILVDHNKTEWLKITLPSGRGIFYMSPQVKAKGRYTEISHMGVDSYTKKWSRLKLIPGRIVENIVQGSARDVMAQGIMNITDNMKSVRLCGTVHDEAIGIIYDRKIVPSTIDFFNTMLCTQPCFPGLPLEAEGYISKRYKKG